MARALVFSIAILALLVIAPTLDEAVGAPPTTAVVEDNTAHLIVSVSPSTLPADGGSYNAIYVEIQTAKGLPLGAPRDINLTLTSSVLQVGSVNPVTQLSSGQTYAAAIFYTTLTPGSTNVTATAKGMKSASVKVTTVSPSGSAVKLGVFASPATLLPLLGSTGKVLVQLLDAGNRPARASSTINVSLASSSPSVADVTPRIVIQKGQTYGTAVTTAAYVAGSTVITASASGLATGTTPVSVEGQNPSKLFVRVAPDVLAPSGEFAVLVVQLQSQDGTPTPAPANITVTITSSNTTVGTVTTPTLTIQVGRTFASGSFLPFKMGTSIVTATAQSYASGFFSVRVVKAGDTTKGGVLALIPALPIVLSDKEAYPVLLAQLRNTTGNPSYSPTNVFIILASSNPFVGSVDTSLIIRAGRTFNTATFDSTLAPGNTNVTASASNFVPTSAVLTSAGPVPYKLAVVLGPALLIANGSSYATTSIQLQDPSGNPAKAPVDITVTLASSSTEVGDVAHSVTIPAGGAHAYTTFTSTLSAGQTGITASAPGYVIGQATIDTVPPAESRLSVYADPATLPADGATHPTLVVQLQDVNGLPVKASLPLSISLSSSNPTAIDVVPRVEITTGATYAVADLKVGLANGTSAITAQAAGLSSATVSPKVLVLPLKAALKVLSPTVLALTPAQVMIQVSSGPFPVPSASVAWSADSRAAKFANATSVTDSTGAAVVSVSFGEIGNVTVSALVSKGAYGQRLVSLKVPVRAQQLTLVVIPDTIDLSTGGATAITAAVTSNGKPVAGVIISWLTTLGTIDQPLTLTDAQGMARVNFAGKSAGVANVTASISQPGYADTSQQVQINVGGASGGGGSIFGYLPYVGMAIVVVIGALFFVRRRRSKGKGAQPKIAEPEAEEEEEEEEV